MKGTPLCHELADALRDRVEPTIAVPTRPQENIPDPDPAAAAGAEIANPDFEAERIMWEGELKGIPKKRAALKTLAQTAYTELMELCDPVLKTKIKALNNYPTLSSEMNPVELLIVIRGMANQVEQNDNQVMAVAGICKQTALMQQGPKEPNEKYYKAFKAMIEAQVVHGGNISLAPGLIATEAAVIAAENGRVDPNDEDSSAAAAIVEEKMNAAFFLLGADEKRHKELLTYLKNQFTVGNDCYPPNMPAALELMETFVPSKPMQVQRPPIPDDEGDGLNFAQMGDEEEVDTGECHYQKKKNSYAKAVKKSIEAPKKQEEAPKKQEDEECSHCGGPHPLVKCQKISLGQLEQIERQLMQKEEEEVGGNFFQTSEMGDESGVMLLHDDGTAPNHSSKLFLDTCTTFPLATNPEFLKNIKPAEKALKYATNAGGNKLTKTGSLGSMGGVYLDTTGLASVTPLKKLEEMFEEVKYSSRERGGAFVCTTSDGKEVLFKRDPKTSFPFIDLDEDGSELAAVTLIQQEEKAEKVNTVRANYEGWTLKEVRDAIRTRKAQAQAGHPSEATLKYEVSHKNENSLYRTCPVTSKAVTNARRIFGPSKECIKGKQVRTKPSRVEPNYVSTPARIVSENRDVHLVGDVMFVNGIPFLVTMSRRIRFATVQHVPDRRAPMLANVMKHVINLYTRSGFNVQTSLMDGEFEKLTEKLSGYIEVNTTAKNEHVGEIERMIRTIKDRCRAMEAAMPFKVLPNIIIKHMVINAVMLRNAHIDKQGISQVYSPRELVLRWNLNFKLHCPLIFGSFCLAYDENDVTNNMKERAIDGIYLGTAGNMQGSNKILSLDTGKVVKRRKVTELPMPESLIVKINKWGKRNKQAGRIRFADRDGNEFEWNDEQLVHDNAPEHEEAVAPFPATPAELPGIDLERNLPGDMLPVVEDEEPSMAERAEAALINAGLAPRQAIENPGVGVQNAGVGGAVNYVPAQEDEIDEIVEHNDDNDDDDDDSSYHTADADDDEPSELDTDVDESSDDEEVAETDNEDELADMDESMNVRRSRRTISRPTDLNYDRLGALANEIEVGEIHLTKGGRVHFHPDTVTSITTRPRTKKKDMSSLYYNESDYKKFKEEADAEDKVDPIELAEDEVELFGFLMMQVSLRKGMELFGEERTKRGAYKEVKQLHDLNVFFPRDPKTLTRRERVMTLSSLIFMKEKHEGGDGVKGRASVNGAPQRAYIPKEEASSPTANNDSIFITSSVGAFQRRDFATLDLPGAFCNTPLEDEVVIMALRGELCELMVRTDPKLYRQYVTTSKNGKPVLYVQLTKALYGLLRSALLFYRKLRKELETYGFEFNPYDPCVCNMMVKMTEVEDGVEKDVLETDEEGRIVFDENGKPKAEMVQFTIVFHVDDLHMSCRNSFEITKFWSYINKLYNNKVNITRGKVHKFLGMRFDYSEEGIFRCDMIDYIKQILADFPEEITKSSPSPHSDNLFKIRDKRELLDEKMASAFHHTVAQLLFLSHRARRDLSPAVPFLTSRVKSPDKDDWGKVRRVLQYLRGTLHMPLRLEVHSTDIPEWDIDASHAVHDDCKGQTGAGMTLGKGAVMAMSWKHKVGSRSSTQSEIIGLHDSLPNVLWSLYFMQSQGYGTLKARVNQDNNSAILLEVNGRASSSKRTKHIKHKYFYIKHCVDEGEIEIRKKDTNDMWCDTYTKPKNGTPYKKDRSMIMNCPLEWPDESIHGPPSNLEKETTKPKAQECVGDRGQKLPLRVGKNEFNLSKR